jgi:hypothetical protein
MLMFCAACLSALAQSGNDVFQLPDGQARAAYQVDIEAVLREKYRQKIETGVNNSILQWSVVDGELPAGLTVRTNGSVAGTPEAPRERPYAFRVKVVDRALADSSSLMISLSVVIAPPRLRLARIEGPALVPVDNSTPPSQGSGPQLSDASETSGPDVSRTAVMTSQPEVKNNNHLPAPADVAASRSGGGGILKKIAAMAGLQGAGANTPSKPKGCEPGSRSRSQESDELKNALEGDTSTQNTCVTFLNLNTLKYQISFNTKTTRTEGPDISSLPFLPKLTLTTSTPTTPPSDKAPSPAFLSARTANVTVKAEKEAATKEAEKDFKEEIDKLNDAFNLARLALNDAETTLREDVEKKINENNTALENAHARAKGVANSADNALRQGNTKGLLQEVDDVLTEIKNALDNKYPADDILRVLSTLDDVTARLEDLRSLVSEDVWKEWLVANQDRYNRVRDRVTELKNRVSSLNSNAFDNGKRVLTGWQRVYKNVQDSRESAFQDSVFVSCHTDEGETKSSKLTISKTDRTIENASAITREVLTVNCYSRIAFTAGFNFSTLDEKEFSVVNSAGADSGSTVKKFGFTNRSSFRPNPLALINIRFTDQPNINWHASFGAVVDLKGQTGTDVEPIAGVSFSIRRLIFITPFALHFGRVNKLAGGFKEGDVVPESIATPPIEKAWKVGYTGGITFRIAPQ